MDWDETRKRIMDDGEIGGALGRLRADVGELRKAVFDKNGDLAMLTRTMETLTSKLDHTGAEIDALVGDRGRLARIEAGQKEINSAIRDLKDDRSSAEKWKDRFATIIATLITAGAAVGAAWLTLLK